MRHTTIGIGLTIAAFLLTTSNAQAQMSAFEITSAMHPGINLGNTLEAPNEGEWAPKAQEFFFDDFKTAGFKTVRIPVRWDKHMSSTAPYTIDSSFMARVDQVVGWSLSRGFITIINSHHDDWIKNNYDEANITRFDSLWAQISRHFSNRTDSLLFEIINEPNGLTASQVDEINSRELATIRKTNPTRIVIFSGYKWSNAEELIAAAVPNDSNIMGYFHSYDPYGFALEGNGTFSSTSIITDKFEKVATWCETNNLPATIDEFGALRSCDYNSRMLHYATYVSTAMKYGIPAIAWDDAGNFQIYNRRNRSWDYEVRDILTKYSNTAPCKIKISVWQDSLLAVSWSNADTDSITNDSIVLMRRLANSEYKRVGVWTPAEKTTQIVDSKTDVGETYYYRLECYKNGNVRQISYPQKHTKLPYFRHTYKELPVLPCTIEAEDYDYGGEQLTYHDADAENSFGQYRPDEAVDIFQRSDGEYLVSANAKNEWIEYTIKVETEGKYSMSILTSAENEGGHLHIKYGNGITKVITVPKSADISICDTTTFTPILAAGEQTIRLVVSSLPTFNIDKMIFDLPATELIADETKISINPNPLKDNLSIDYSGLHYQISILDIFGQTILSRNNCSGPQNIDMSRFKSGTYIVIISKDSFSHITKIIKE